MPYLCASDYQYYLELSNPIKYFYTVDFIGQLDRFEAVHVGLIQNALANAWSLAYPASYNPTPFLSNKFELRIGSLGTQVTRVAYVMSLNGRRVPSYLYSPPSNASLESQLRQLGSDLRIYSARENSIGKALLSSLYVQSYPLSPTVRPRLEAGLRAAIFKTLNLTASLNANVVLNLLYYEPYYGLQTNQKVSRVYYAVKFTH
jgi:hypothetical protein